MAGQGHNSGESFGVVADEIRQFIERAEHVEDEISTAREDLKAVFAEAKGRGFDTKALKRLIKQRKADRDKLAEEQAVYEIYATAIGEDVFG